MYSAVLLCVVPYVLVIREGAVFFSCAGLAMSTLFLQPSGGGVSVGKTGNDSVQYAQRGRGDSAGKDQEVNTSRRIVSTGVSIYLPLCSSIHITTINICSQVSLDYLWDYWLSLVPTVVPHGVKFQA